MTDEPRAELVRERQDAYDMATGPYGYQRVGFSVGGRVFWVGCCGTHMNNETWLADESLARSIVERLNRPTR